MDAIRRFAELVDRSAADVELARAALAFAAVADPALDADTWLGEIDRLAVGVTHFQALRERLFVEEGFTGAADDYHNPDNSLLHRVLARRRGIPISLSVVAIEAGRRAGIVVEGIAMPGHFLIRGAGSAQCCDPFHGGALLDERACEEGFRQVTGADPSVPFGAEVLPVADDHQILTRMLANLAHIYRAQARLSDLEWVLRCQRVVPGMAAQATLQLGEALAAQGRFRDAARELEATAAASDPTDRQQLVQAARAVRARLN